MISTCPPCVVVAAVVRVRFPVTSTPGCAAVHTAEFVTDAFHEVLQTHLLVLRLLPAASTACAAAMVLLLLLLLLVATVTVTAIVAGFAEEIRDASAR